MADQSTNQPQAPLSEGECKFILRKTFELLLRSLETGQFIPAGVLVWVLWLTYKLDGPQLKEVVIKWSEMPLLTWAGWIVGAFVCFACGFNHLSQKREIATLKGELAKPKPQITP